MLKWSLGTLSKSSKVLALGQFSNCQVSSQTFLQHKIYSFEAKDFSFWTGDSYIYLVDFAQKFYTLKLVLNRWVGAKSKKHSILSPHQIEFLPADLGS